MKKIILTGGTPKEMSIIHALLAKAGHIVDHEPAQLELAHNDRAVFMLEPIDSYRNDGAMGEKERTAIDERLLLAAKYAQKGYAPIQVPVLPPEGRVKFILDTIYKAGQKS